ncbi:hypothetical protein ABEB36_007449 [Hypothenemus hampei]|uniref:C-type lectin domain-containing protein n=1 Tax=Hypothenemus hampei TaxID=57062 RepID=A0ABD1ETZ4_HYPHA
MLKATFLLAALFAVNTEYTIEAANLTATNNYELSQVTASFLQAWAYCNNRDQQFVSLPSLAQHNALASYLSDAATPTLSVWVGGLYLSTGVYSQWLWVDGEEAFNWSYFTSSTIKSDDTCIVYNYNANTKSGSWSTDYCSNKRYFVCLNA